MSPALPIGRNVIALVFDFDDTLVPDSTTKFLMAKGVDPSLFWDRARGLVQQGYDSALAWLQLFTELTAPGKELEGLSEKELMDFGATLDEDAFEGLPTFFDEVRQVALDIDRDANVEFYIISGGLKPVVSSVGFVKSYFRAVYASELAVDDAGALRHIRRAVNFTEKTRYLFEISKGIDPDESALNPYLVNKAVENRRIPWRNIIYVGDGLTDVPCFSLVTHNGGWAYGVFNPEEESKAKRAFEDLLSPQRVGSLNSPRFRATDDLGAILRLNVSNLVTELKVAASSYRG